MEVEKLNKSEWLKFRCTGLEKAVIEYKASTSGQSVSAYCRASALNQEIDYKLTEEELEAYKMLAKFHSNFSRITNLLNDKDSSFAKEVSDTASEIKRHLKKFQ